MITPRAILCIYIAAARCSCWQLYTFNRGTVFKNAPLQSKQLQCSSHKPQSPHDHKMLPDKVGLGLPLPFQEHLRVLGALHLVTWLYYKGMLCRYGRHMARSQRRDVELYCTCWGVQLQDDCIGMSLAGAVQARTCHSCSKPLTSSQHGRVKAYKIEWQMTK